MRGGCSGPANSEHIFSQVMPFLGKGGSFLKAHYLNGRTWISWEATTESGLAKLREGGKRGSKVSRTVPRTSRKGSREQSRPAAPEPLAIRLCKKCHVCACAAWKIPCSVQARGRQSLPSLSIETEV